MYEICLEVPLIRRDCGLNIKLTENYNASKKYYIFRGMPHHIKYGTKRIKIYLDQCNFSMCVRFPIYLLVYYFFVKRAF